MAEQKHELFIDHQRRNLKHLDKSGRALTAAQIRFVGFGILEAIKVLENAGIEGDAISILREYSDKLNAQASSIEA